MAGCTEEKVEHASDIIGEWGPFQTKIFLLAFNIYFVAPFQNRAIVFYAPRLDFWCKKSSEFENVTLQTCSSYENSSAKCTEWEYDTSFYHSTMIDHFDLVCDRAWWVSVAQSSFQFGYLISSILFGLISDRFGRLTALKLAVVLSICAGVGQAFAPNIYLFVTARLIGGIAAFGRFLSFYVLLMEYSGPLYRAKIGPGIEFSWAISSMIQPGINYLIPNFFYMQLIVLGYEVLSSTCLFKMWESPRWLLTNGHFEKAREIITMAAEENGKITTEQIEAKLERLRLFVNTEADLVNTKPTLLDIYKDRTFLKNCILLYVIWFAMSFVLYGVTFNMGDFGGSLFINNFVTSVGGFLVQVMLFFVVDKITRKQLLYIGYFFGAGSFFVMASVTQLSPVFMTVLAFIAFSAMTIAYTIDYIYAAEIFPTSVRQVAMGSCSFMARIGSISAPFMRELTELTHLSVTLSIYGILSAISGVIVYFLPETQGKEMPDKLKQSKRRTSPAAAV